MNNPPPPPRSRFFITVLAATAQVAGSLEGEYFRGDDLLSYCGAVDYCQHRQSELAIIRNSQQNIAATKACGSRVERDKKRKWHDEHLSLIHI